MLRRLSPTAAAVLCGLVLAGIAPSRAEAQGGDPRPLMVLRASEPLGLKVPIGDASSARQCAGLFSHSLFVLYDDFSLEVRTPDARQIVLYFRNATFQPFPEPGVLTRARMQGTIESGPFAGATVRAVADTRDTGIIYVDLQVMQGAEPRDDLPPWWPSEKGAPGATLQRTFWVLLQRIWARGVESVTRGSRAFPVRLACSTTPGGCPVRVTRSSTPGSTP